MIEDLVLLANQLAAASVNQCLLPGAEISSSCVKLSREKLIRLINEASILAFSKEPHERMMAYDIVTQSLQLSKKRHPAFIQTVDFILSRLANFPARRLLRKRHHASLQEANLIAVPLVMESWVREHDNTVPGFAHPLTDFQLDFFSAIETKPFVSISAPTSAGKSFVLGQHIIRHFRQTRPSCVIYIVPTRALIREVMLRLRKELRDAGLGAVAQRCVPSLATPEETPEGIVYVLTQERLLRACYEL